MYLPRLQQFVFLDVSVFDTPDTLVALRTPDFSVARSLELPGRYSNWCLADCDGRLRVVVSDDGMRVLDVEDAEAKQVGDVIRGAAQFGLALGCNWLVTGETAEADVEVHEPARCEIWKASTGEQLHAAVENSPVQNIWLDATRGQLLVLRQSSLALFQLSADASVWTELSRRALSRDNLSAEYDPDYALHPNGSVFALERDEKRADGKRWLSVWRAGSSLSGEPATAQLVDGNFAQICVRGRSVVLVDGYGNVALIDEGNTRCPTFTPDPPSWLPGPAPKRAEQERSVREEFLWEAACNWRFLLIAHDENGIRAFDFASAAAQTAHSARCDRIEVRQLSVGRLLPFALKLLFCRR